MKGLTVLNLALGPDTGGQGIRLKRAFDAHAPGWAFNSVVSTPNYMRYPIDVRYRRHHVEALYRDADVVHLRNRLDGHAMFDSGAGKPTVLHHHGTHFRTHHESLAYEARRLGAVQMVSTVDLELLEPDVTWLPAPYDLDALRAIREAEYRPSDIIRIAHAPTNRGVKGTDLVLAAIAELEQRHPIEFDLIERRPWAECLVRKARADIFIDQLVLGYGCNAIEAWGMGIPVVSGVTDAKVARRMREVWGSLPFFSASRANLVKRLEQLIESRSARDEWGAIGAAHAARFHDERLVVAQLQGIYAAAPRTTPGPIVTSSVRYTRRNVPRRAVEVAGAA